jgi:hypothetical protein
MPRVEFEQLPDDARVWVFGADRALTADERRRLFEVVDAHLERWAAHGEPLTSARDWRHDRFLTVGVDQRTAGASGCSIDVLFRQLQSLERELGASLVGGGRVFWRATAGEVRSADREEFAARAARGEITPSTRVFDPTVATLGDWRRGFERAAGESWHSSLIR